MSDIESIDGTITLEDGTKVSFRIDPDDGGYSQWGAPTSVLGTTADVVDAMGSAVRDALYDL